MLTLLYTRITELAASPRAVWWLVIVAMAEASVFPLPVDLMLVPMLLANRERAWFLALVCTLASVAGGLIGWVLGAFLMEHIGMPIAHFYHADQRILNLEAMFRHYGVWIILAKGLTPLPYKFVTLAAGAAHFSLLPFIAASIVTRGARFFLEAALLRTFGEPIRDFIEKRLALVLFAVLILIAAGIILIEIF
ncbi:YqaA family protein [Gluconobacter oxydans]|uniref:DedA family protein n=2 Tax=Gluconobacter oxydans TaxID=442 RepID=Q5FQN8_GLUOX|nr:YqaA family protein [Gluconobacter oxydans]AAW61308.1 DedA family protein [Gluconobacter oxydans 621H]KXV32029.1 cytochrome B [Gluconobacter oxydans]MBF0857127.1 DedA family protein [Gluconobacter oxydans]TCW23194.1 membrane protein YqaA with SNARE-associated domain [Gluconobacter oxydans]GEC61689.1 cytochrome b561 [Gluconobacter oxydans]